jgi:tetratricopeptide (TPR) repeat protein
MLALGGCASAPPLPVWSGSEPEAIVADIRAAQAFEGTKSTPGELEVQPLRDPMVEDLRQQAVVHERAKRYADAASALDKALAISPDDPALLQERAEAAVLTRDIDRAERLATDAYELGAKVGPLCRRHWATIAAALRERAQQRRGQAAASKRDEDRARFDNDARAADARAIDAKRRIDDCTLTGPPRY